MNNYKKYAFAFLFAELILIGLCNIFMLKTMKDDQDKAYKVDVVRAANEMRRGTTIENLDLSKYETLIAVQEYRENETCNYAYEVEEVGGVLYQFAYQRGNDSGLVVVMNIFLGSMFVCTFLVFVFINQKIVKPFSAVSSLPKELAKGNLTVPIKEEKSKFFGKFLWGMDMLREKLEQDKVNELELVKEKKTLVLSLSHDIKTPLSAIELYTKALSNHLYDDEEKMQQSITGIANNTELIRQYVDEISKVSREDFLKLEVTCGEFYLTTLMNHILDYYKDKMKQIHTEFIIDEVENCLLYGDFDRSVEVIQNICENAIKYGDGKWIRISFSEEEGCKLITIKNGGCSLKEEELTNIFDSFYRGSNSENIQGSGLGLYICKELLHKMDGEVFGKICDDTFAITVVMRKM
ncbi:MAG: ATP-binding protein [Lachnospiraceae bacterium]